MRRVVMRGSLFVSLLVFAQVRANAVYELVVSTQHASVVSGVVTDPSDAPIGGVSVVQFACGKGEFRGVSNPAPLARTITRADGTFSLSWRSGSRACIQFLANGFNPMQVEVKRRKGAGRLRLKLPIGG